MPFVPFKAKVYDVLAADATLTAMLATVPGTSRPAIYVNHLSTVERVLYPAVSLAWSNAGANQAVQIADGGAFLVDVWTEEAAADPSLVANVSGAWAIYKRIKRSLHRAHLGALLRSSEYQLSYCVELDAEVNEEFDEQQKLYHLQGRYRVQLVEAGAFMAYPH
jgi:hypothetical protein